MARCPLCRNFYCRECVTEHEGRVVCAACLKIAVQRAPGRRSLLRFASGGLPAAGLLLAWMLFYAIGRVLMLLPASVHDGTLWGK